MCIRDRWKKAVCAANGDFSARWRRAAREDAGRARNLREEWAPVAEQSLAVGGERGLEDDPVHVAFGNNASMGGSIDVPFHVDGIILKPTLTLDGEALLRDGRPLFA